MLRRTFPLGCFLLLAFAFPHWLPAAEKTWNVGYAQRSLVPEDIETKTYYLGGWGEDKPVAGVYDPIWVRCLSLDAGSGRKVVLASIDVVGLRYNQVVNIRKLLEDWSKKNNVVVEVMSTHNHASLDTIGIWGPPGKTGRDDAYLTWLEKTVAETVQEACAAAKPGKLVIGQIMAPGMVVDDSPPRVANEQITIFRFEPEDKNVKPTWLMHFSCHPEGLGKPNYHLSSDFVHATREIIEKTKNCNAMYINGAVGSMQTVPALFDENGERSRSYEVVCKFGRTLGEYALGIDHWDAVPVELVFRSKTISVPLYNLKLRAAAEHGLLQPFIPGEQRESRPEMLKLGRKATEDKYQPTSLTEVGYMRLGNAIGVVFVTGDLAPEQAKGKYLAADDCVNPEMPTEKPLFDILPEKTKLVFGLANDEIGYILPANNYYISPTKPWVPTDDKFGRGHYPETNGTGPETPEIIAQTLEELVRE